MNGFTKTMRIGKMAYTISEECIACDACRPMCPTNSIQQSIPIYAIATETCTECVMDFYQPRCVAVCPVDAIMKHPDFEENRRDLLHKRNRIVEFVAVS